MLILLNKLLTGKDYIFPKIPRKNFNATLIIIPLRLPIVGVS
jgi:hypothetical protein